MSQSQDKCPQRNGSSRHICRKAINNAGQTIFYYFFRTEDHSDPNMVCDTPPPKDASIHQIWDSYLKCSRQDYSRNEVRGQGHGHSNSKMVCDTPPLEDASTHQIWNSYLKYYRRYAPDIIILEMRSDVKVTVTKNNTLPPQDISTHQIWNSYL